MVVDDTPIESYRVCGVDVLVKREDLCCPYPGPSFSKMRGVMAHLRNRTEKTIGVLDTFHSKAGWAVAYACNDLGKQCVNFWPLYTSDRPGVLREPQQRSKQFGARLVDLKAWRSSIMFHRAKRWLGDEYPGAYMMPNALKLPESVEENAQEAKRCARFLPDSCAVVLSISSGTVAAGVINGLAESGARRRFVLHMGYSRSIDAVRRYLSGFGRVPPWVEIEFVDEQYAYSDRVNVDVPFPCNPYYDAKAWKWLVRPQNISRLSRSGSIVFWNIGA